MRQDRKRRMIAHDQGVAVRPRFCDGVGGDDTVAAEAVFNDCRVSVFAEPLREDAGGKIAEPPAGTPTTILIGCDGASCACIGVAAKSMQSTSSAAPRPRRLRPEIPIMLLLRVLVHGLANLLLGVATDQRSGCTTILTNPPGRVCTSASASLTFARG
jgi:hypothetical protein